MIITKFCYLNERKYCYPIVGILLIGIFLVINGDNVQVLQVSSYENKSQQGNSALVSSKTTSIKENFNGHEYLLIEEYKNWTNAKIDCESRGGHLVTISSQEENDFITDLIGINGIHIGLTDEVTEGDWQWVTGEPNTYTNWGSGQPSSSAENIDYAFIPFEGNGYWFTGIGFTAMYYVCEFENQETSGNFNGHEYEFIQDSQTWSNAKIDCESRGGHLVTINSQEENDFIVNLIGTDFIWIGLTDEAIEGNWQWVTGEPVTYTSWNQSEPNDAGEGEDYAEMEDGNWNDNGGPADPSLTHFYVCEIEHELTTPTIIFPDGGEILDGKITIEWRKAVDPQGHSISYSVFYSSDNGSTWVSFDMSGLVEGFEINYCYLDWDTSTLLNGTNFLLKVIATCSFGGEAEDITDNFFTIHYVTKPTSITINYNTNSEGIINIVWSPSVDSLGQNITYSVYYSSDTGNTWILLVAGLTETNYDWNTTTVRDGRNYLIKVVTTSFNGLSTENILFGMLTIDNIPLDNTFLIIALAFIAVFPEFYIFRKLKKFMKYLIFEEGVETP